MHISEGILTPSLLGGGWVITVAGLFYGMRRTAPADIPRVALLSAAFFVVTFVRIPLGPAHLHLVATGLVGILLGWSVFPALFVALLLQAVLFQFGGLAVLGANTMIMAWPAIMAHYVFRWLAGAATPSRVLAAAGFAGVLAVIGNTIFMAGLLVASEPAFRGPAIGVLLFHIPLILVEGVITALAVSFLYRVRSDLLPLMK